MYEEQGCEAFLYFFTVAIATPTPLTDFAPGEILTQRVD